MDTTLGNVRRHLIDSYNRRPERRSFISILDDIQAAGEAVEALPIPEASADELLSFERFIRFLMDLPVNLEAVRRNSTLKTIYENATILPGCNVRAYVHLPYVDDRMHEHDHFEINYVYRGSARQEIDTEKRVMAEGELCIIAPHMRHNVLVDDPDGLVISLAVRKTTFDTIFGKLLTQSDLLSEFFRDTLYRESQSNYLLFQTAPEDRRIIELIQMIAIESNSRQKYAAVFADNTVTMLFYVLLRKYSDSILYYGHRPKEGQTGFPVILTYVQDHYRNVTLEELAQRFNYSEGYLSRMFAQTLHKPFNKVVQNLRMQNGARLLQETGLTIEEVAIAVGYESADHFSRTFKAVYGCSPSKYRKTMQE